MAIFWTFLTEKCSKMAVFWAFLTEKTVFGGSKIGSHIRFLHIRGGRKIGFFGVFGSKMIKTAFFEVLRPKMVKNDFF